MMRSIVCMLLNKMKTASEEKVVHRADSGDFVVIATKRNPPQAESSAIGAKTRRIRIDVQNSLVRFMLHLSR